MAWVKLSGESPSITVRATGIIEWNDETQRQLNMPKAVELLYDADTNKLAIRNVDMRGVTGLVVSYDTELNFWYVDADYELDNADIKPAEDVEGSLTGPTTLGVGESGEAGCFWLALS